MGWRRRHRRRPWVAAAVIVGISHAAAFVGPIQSVVLRDDARIFPSPITSRRLAATGDGGTHLSGLDDDDDDDASWATKLRDRLGLTHEQAAEVRRHLPANRTARDAARSLAWLEGRMPSLRSDNDRLRDIVTGYPEVLGLPLETNLMPTVNFFADALRDPYRGDDEANEEDVLLADFLSQTPRLLEYNVEKRLRPRLARVRAVAADVHGARALARDEVKAIAVKTDSRFEQWLRGETGPDPNIDGRDVGNETFIRNGQYSSGDATLPQPRADDEALAYVVVSNLQSGSNIGKIVRSASIFGVAECIVVGQKRYKLAGDHGARFDVPRHHVWSHAEARDYLRLKSGGTVRVYGVEIVDGATPIMRYDRETGVMRFPFDRKWKGAAFIFGNEGLGLSAKQREICDEFVFIPQTRGGTEAGGGSASMNVACAAAVILQAYCTWAGYSDAQIQGEKFVAHSERE